ncbi:putative baseplate assembly protein [Komarekiella sp. 'clone 1']|uniref:Baseplate assembly protein n=1 Tax=Komarekiella delphini-convector SJRDD-AB1 TaxID=2593771 RepID=A0AA40T037_9NOST|nr:putative baseplate assembly protein [Komarekiella delphini-convector]MBD6618219.1 putative baseplate assembly protein [Komarekiella delphini-convector SJRDD-AB1]
MVSTQYRCKNERRRNEVRKRKDADGLPILNGIDYLEVATDQKTLFVHFIHILEQNTLTIENIQVRRLEGTTVIEVPIESVSASSRLLTIMVTAPKDVFTYTMRLVEAFGNEKPPTGFDSQLAQVEFLFQVADLSEFDCKTPTEPTEKPPLPPVIDYLAKDYTSFRQLMLDRLAVTMPHWQERSPADLGIMLVELVAYKADYLSYFQDAVATEAYLGTARKRVSVRRHARLLNYPMHDGCNARTWLTLRVNQPVTLPDRNTAKIRFLTNVPGLPSILSEKEFDIAINRGAQVFEAMEDTKLDPVCNEIHFYTWSDLTCVLPTGAIAATLKDETGKLAQLLQPGTVLIIEEVKGAQSGEPADADLTHRHVVRLTKVTSDRDPLEDVSLVEIEWSQEDALPFPITISQMVGDRPIYNISIVRGNVILVDHGYTVDGSERMLDWVSAKNRYRARLRERPLTQQGRVRDFRFDPTASAAAVWKWEMRDVMPAIFLEEQDASTEEINFWYPQRDLLNSDRFAREFVVEMEDDGRAYLRFGDGQVGRQPQADATLTAIYRIGNGTAGNVGAEAIAHLFCKAWDFQEVLQANTNPIRNPLPARGGVDPEPIEQVRLYAPQAFRTLQRAVTEADYAEIVQRFPGVSRALATRRWTGSWYTIFITVDRQNGLLIDETFKQELTSFLEQFRLTGQDVEIESPSFIPLDIALKVQVAPDYFQSQVKEALLNAFSNKVLGEGRLGFFHPDNFSFGQPVYLSKVIAQAMQVTGVQSVTAKRFQRWGLPPQNELELGRIVLGRLEIARLDNDANMPGQGRLELLLEGGL